MDAEKVYIKYEQDIKKSLKAGFFESDLESIVILETKGTKDLIETLKDNYKKIDDFKSKIKAIFEPLLYIEDYQFKLYPDFFEVNVSVERNISDDFPKQIENKLREGQLDGKIIDCKSEPAIENVCDDSPSIFSPVPNPITGKYFHTYNSKIINKYCFNMRIVYTNEFKKLYTEFNTNWSKAKGKSKELVKNYESLFDECEKRFGIVDKLRVRKIKPNFETVKIISNENTSASQFMSKDIYFGDRFYPFKEAEMLEGN